MLFIQLDTMSVYWHHVLICAMWIIYHHYIYDRCRHLWC